MKKIYLLFFISFLLSGHTVMAEEVSFFKFVTDPQNIELNQISKDITVQSQNSSGSQQPVLETFDLTFTTTSATGQFLNSSGNPVATYMSKNTSNRTFYYKDSSEGDFVILVTATGRDSKKTFSATQHIFVGNTFQNTSGSSSTTDTKNNQSNSSVQTHSVSVSDLSSAHSSPAPISTSKDGIDFEISAGRDRLVTVGNKVEFRVVLLKSQNISVPNTYYEWSFGDGTTAMGDSVSHAYKFEGEYVVVVNAFSSDKQAVSRIKVVVISPEISLAKVPGGLEVWNKSKSEINLEGWALSIPSKNFTFPKDTLIPSGKKVIFADEVTGIYNDSTKLSNQEGKIFALIENIQPVLTKVESVETESSQSAYVPKVNTINDTSDKIKVVGNGLNEISTPETETKKQDESTNVAQVFVAEKKTGFISSVFSWPIKGFDFIRKLFVEK